MEYTRPTSLEISPISESELGTKCLDIGFEHYCRRRDEGYSEPLSTFAGVHLAMLSMQAELRKQEREL